MTNNEDLSKNMTSVRKAPAKSTVAKPAKSTVAKPAKPIAKPAKPIAKPAKPVAKPVAKPAKPVAKAEAVDDFAVFEATPIKKEIKNPILKILDYFIGFSEPDFQWPQRQEIETMIIIISVFLYLGIFGYIYERHQLNKFQQQQQQEQEIRELLKEAEEEKRKEQFFH